MNILLTIAQILFWLALSLIFLSYIGGLIILKLRLWFKKPTEIPKFDGLPSISILIPAYNEADVIGDKLRNTIEQDYPPDLREIVVISDQSTDKTDEIVLGFSTAGVKLIKTDRRMGKLGILDTYVPSLSGEVIVITDANMMLSPDALKKLASYFNDPKVGLVGGNTIFRLKSQRDKSSQGELVYHNFETYAKTLMSKLGTVICVYGGFYAIRRTLYKPIGHRPGHDDVILPIEVLAAGYQTHFSVDALAFEVLGSSKKEFQRHIRLSAYSLNSFFRVIRTSLKAGLWVFLLASISKVLRWISPYLLGLLFILLFLLIKVGIIYKIFMGLFALGGICFILGALLYLFGIYIFIFNAIFYFALINFSAYLGLIRWIKGIKPYWAQLRQALK